MKKMMKKNKLILQLKKKMKKSKKNPVEERK